MDLSSEILKAVRAMGFEEPSTVQAKTIPPMMEGQEINAIAPTGTVKTCVNSPFRVRTPVPPLLPTRTIGTPHSTARSVALARCCSGSLLRGYHASLESASKALAPLRICPRVT